MVLGDTGHEGWLLLWALQGADWGLVTQISRTVYEQAQGYGTQSDRLGGF